MGYEFGLNELQLAVIVAMFAVLTMDVPPHDVVDVTGVWDRDVTAIHAVHVIARVGGAGVAGPAGAYVARAELMFVDVVAVRMVQMRVVDVIDVVLVTNREMSARLTVHVIVPVVRVRFGERFARVGI